MNSKESIALFFFLFLSFLEAASVGFDTNLALSAICFGLIAIAFSEWFL